MKRFSLPGILAASTMLTASCRNSGNQQHENPGSQLSVREIRSEKEEEPLLLDDAPEEAPLLLDDAPLLLDDAPLLLEDDASEDERPAGAGPMADNSRCFVCHINYKKENLAVIHARAKIGCVDCHGDCDEHIADESWASGGNGTPPGIMYRRADINPCCLKCHPAEKIDPKQHKDILAGTHPQSKYCTDCHGSHRLAERKCKWK